MTTRTWIASVSIAIALAAGAAMDAAQSGPSTRLAGIVVDATAANQPVRRAIVTITGDLLPAGRSAVTDDDGKFVFDRVPAGTFTLTATRPGFLKTSYGATRPGRNGSPLTVRAGASVSDLLLAMTRGSVLDGILRDSAGDPAPGMRVEAILVRRRSDGDHGQTAGAVLTDDRGEFRIYGLPPGDYVLSATPAAIIGGIGDIGAPSEAEVDALLASLPRRAPQAPKLPSPSSPSAGNSAPIPAKTKGYSTPAVFYPGVFQSGEANRITLGPAEVREGLDFAMRLSHSADVDGTIVPVRGQTAVPQLQIAIRSAGVELPVFGGGMGGPMLSMRPAEHTFHVSNVPPGRYRITARSFGAPGSSTQVISSGGALPKPDPSTEVQWALADVDMGGDDIGGVTLALQPALRVSGRIAFAGADLKPPADASAVRIALEPIADRETGSNGLTEPIPGVVQPDGTFVVPSLIPGRYRITTTLAGWWPRSAMLNSRDALDLGVTIGTSDVTGLTVTMTDRRSSLGGTFSTQSGAPASGYFLVAFSTDRTMWRAPSRRVLSTRPSTDGAFELRDLPAGSYYLAAVNDLEAGDLEDAAFLEALTSSAVTLALAEGERKRQDIRIAG